MTTPQSYLRTIKILHTVIWAFFAGCILAIPIMALTGWFLYAFIFIGIVMIEVLVLIYNRWSCPLTGIAARFTDDRKDNFDIYLPEVLARHNKVVFGSIFGVGVVLTLIRWVG